MYLLLNLGTPSVPIPTKTAPKEDSLGTSHLPCLSIPELSPANPLSYADFQQQKEIHADLVGGEGGVKILTGAR